MQVQRQPEVAEMKEIVGPPNLANFTNWRMLYKDLLVKVRPNRSGGLAVFGRVGPLEPILVDLQ